MTFSIMICTRNRRVDLEVTCWNLAGLEPGAQEVIICADGCVDGTAEMLKTKFPRFKLVKNERPMGSVYCRDRLVRLARGEVVLSLDDDSYPVSRDFLLRLARAFNEHPEAAVVAFPELRDGGKFAAPDKADRSPGHYVSAYAHCAAALRRGFYLERPGFPALFGHMYEETDYALQCYAAGAAVWFEPSLTVRHHVSPVNRRLLARHQSNARNELWSVWMRCPWPWLPVVSGYRLLRQLVYAGSEGASWGLREPAWWWAALKGWPRCLRLRRPVDWRSYYAWMRLARRPVHSLPELRRKFPRVQ